MRNLAQRRSKSFAIRGADVWIHEYLKDPPTRDQLEQLYKRAGISPREGLRAKEPLAEELGLTRTGRHRRRILDAMVEHPILIEPPAGRDPQGRPPVPPAGRGPRDSLALQLRLPTQARGKRIILRP